MKLKDPDDADRDDQNQNDSIIMDQMIGATLRANLRFTYSRIKFLESLLTDIDALIQKEQEYMDYLEGIMSSINFIVVRTQAVIRGWIARKRFKEMKLN